MLEKIKSDIKKYFYNENIIFEEVNQGRTNLNFFVKNNGKEYFIRTSISKVKDILFGGLLEKEEKILKILGNKLLSPKLIYSFISEDYGFLIIEKINGNKYISFENDLEKIKILLEKFQKIDINNFDFLDKFSLKDGYKKIILERVKNIQNLELSEINKKLINYLFDTNYNFEDEFCLTHNDFRLDNLLITDKKVYMIDVEGMSVSDKYLDIGEYYVGGIFWDTFSDKKELVFEDFSKLMDDFGYINKEKQSYVFLLKFLSNFSWLSSYIDSNKNIEKVYTESLERNKKQFYFSIEKLIK